jgi:uncharacterized GH25 family protein
MNARVTLLLLVLAAAPAAAHDTWLLRAGAPSTPHSLEFELTSAGSFPEPESAVAAARILRSGLRLAGRQEPLEAAGQRAKALRLRARATGDGIAVAWVETKPRTLTLSPQELDHYLEEVGARETIGPEWKRSGLASWRESYVKLAKALVRAGSSRTDASWGEAVGLDLELVPESDPTSLRSGERLVVRAVFKGQPLAGLAIGAATAGRSLPLQTSDAQGRASFPIDGAGPWLIRATRLERAALSDAEWRSWFATLTFEVAKR